VRIFSPAFACETLYGTIHCFCVHSIRSLLWALNSLRVAPIVFPLPFLGDNCFSRPRRRCYGAYANLNVGRFWASQPPDHVIGKHKLQLSCRFGISIGECLAVVNNAMTGQYFSLHDDSHSHPMSVRLISQTKSLHIDGRAGARASYRLRSLTWRVWNTVGGHSSRSLLCAELLAGCAHGFSAAAFG